MKSNSLLQKKWNGILIFKNLESNQEMFEMLIGDMSDTPNQVSTVALTTLNSDPLKEQTFFNIGDFAGICSEVFIFYTLYPLIFLI